MRALALHRLAPLALVAAAILLVVGAGWAADDEASYSALNGSGTYRTYCSNCHGVDGRGDGYIADTLRVTPTDLTRLAARNGGVFPAERVWKVIDGREEVKSHGSREMPLWGDVFLWPETDSPERRQLVKRKIGELVAHLESIQVVDAKH